MTTTEALEGLVKRLERVVDVLEDDAGTDLDIYSAQAVMEQLEQPPNRIELTLGATPVSLGPWYGSHAWLASAVWGPGDTRTTCYGTTWVQALCELASVLALKEGRTDG